MHEQSHSVMRLPVHLPNQQPVYFQQGHEEEALDRATSADSLLTSWFHLNQNSQEARQHLYTEIPNHYVIKPPGKTWVLRKRGGDKIIPRMYSVSPRDTERFHLRMLLLHKPGATSYEDLCTVNGHIAPTFKEACKLLNLLIDDTEWDNTLTEASAFQMPSRLRSLFATICLHCSPADPMQLWITHKDALMQDYVQLHHLSNENAENAALQDIEHFFMHAGATSSDFGLPAILSPQTLSSLLDFSLVDANIQTTIDELNSQQ